ncbi:radical SAM protein with 4Fe4S-binding SPASM domain [Nitrospirillum amazonense]|uniref:Radical SAM protein with 4Fe4S-binding SPASM domain n=1 Tax=Nitrospirillum amazonense TaxID=28077 RepID=A0A560F1U7_9PROT|nr:radical SAM protein [Nitrospirillum amazonense]TWB15475.1 radical SAM protein with 4Fe4S-binding SPASM domain [Nitrospirillum amazonense]
MGAFPLARAWRGRRLVRVPVVTLMPHSRCNCRCVMCDIWKANRNGTSLEQVAVDRLVDDFGALGVRWVVLSGGEALMHPNLWGLCAALKTLPLKITLLSSGLLLERHAADIVEWCDEVIVSLDGPEATHNRIRGIKDAYGALAAGVGALRRRRAGYPVAARCVIQRGNFRELPAIIDAAKAIGLDSISFLGADLTSTAFNRPQAWGEGRVEEVGLFPAECDALDAVIDGLAASHGGDFTHRYIQESPARLRHISARYRAAHGVAPSPPVRCNAPWVSTVVEADGTVRPCFFHDPIGSLRDGTLPEILNGSAARSFRAGLDVDSDPVCQRCVCSLKL